MSLFRYVSRQPMLAALVLTALLAMTPTASATVVVTDFDSFSLGGTYGVWADVSTTITSGPTAMRVETTGGWGGGWHELPLVVDASGGDGFELDVTFNAANQTPVIVLGVQDGDGTFYNWAWYGLPVNGAMTLSTASSDNFWESAAGATAGFDYGAIFAFHIQGDGNPNLPADISFENLNAVPEPASLALIALGGLAVLRRRRAA